MNFEIRYTVKYYQGEMTYKSFNKAKDFAKRIGVKVVYGTSCNGAELRFEVDTWKKVSVIKNDIIESAMDIYFSNRFDTN